MKDIMEYKRLHFQTLPSTNNFLKEKRAKMQAFAEEKSNYIVTAEWQSGGRGTKGRSFLSEKGGVYLSVLTFYEDFKAKDAFLLLAKAAVAVCETLRDYGLQPVIKWSNDVYVNDKKIAGILIENVFSGENISSSVIGIGLNVMNALAPEIEKIATSMQQVTGKDFSVQEVTERLISQFKKERTMGEYLSYIGYMDREVLLIIGDERVHGRLIFVDNEGKLHVEINGKERCLTSAEVSFLVREGN